MKKISNNSFTENEALEYAQRLSDGQRLIVLRAITTKDYFVTADIKDLQPWEKIVAIYENGKKIGGDILMEAKG